MEKLNFNEVETGMRVKDQDGDIGTVTKIDSINNIVVTYDSGGIGYICLSADCCADYLIKI